MISGLHIKYYAYLKNNYCKGPEVSEYMRKNAKQVGSEGNRFKVHEICKPSSKRKKQTYSRHISGLLTGFQPHRKTLEKHKAKGNPLALFSSL